MKVRCCDNEITEKNGEILLHTAHVINNTITTQCTRQNKAQIHNEGLHLTLVAWQKNTVGHLKMEIFDLCESGIHFQPSEISGAVSFI